MKGDAAALKTYVGDVHVGTFRDLAEKVARLESLGVDGYLHGDHLFVRVPGEPGEHEGHMPPAADPFSTLAAVGALSEQLVLGTLVANAGLCHPALILRHFVQLAALFGGERVLAGLGAGWSSEEFEALGRRMPPVARRMEHLAGAAELARAWFDEGSATLDGATFVARDLPMAPALAEPPRLMVGGGSPTLMRIAGRYADHVDVHPLSRSVPNETGRFLTTTMDDATRCVELLEAAEEAAGRSPGTVTRSMWMGFIEFCEPAEYRGTEDKLCRSAGIEPRDLRDCPYVLLGDPSEMAALVAERRERLGLDAVVVGIDSNLARFMTDVVPQL
jgi:alkanesulfonate monooxygenase SsuD/methylene tetrahydromethanopterin reductase-like flavin-dependent oxidoreductase (luciferase family)